MISENEIRDAIRSAADKQNPVITLMVESSNAASERRFQQAITVAELKQKLCVITGITAGSMLLSCDSVNSEAWDDDKTLGTFSSGLFFQLPV